ncbi:hypothetical protein LUW76_08245 [Actinomadura madurae]|uniref:hypothetical protein n=1 Tax=Actinomadura madurae TaxID=1993 RepID=UPI0020272D35|nr:hypothetical protein [Actinomadura madurae]URM94320.1 hypothetical protein LUW76_08245 [Actinomadura madurae]
MRPDHQYLAGLEMPVVEEPRDPVQPHGRLTGARPALHDEDALALVRHQQKLLALDRLDDVAHVPVAGPLQVLEKEVLQLFGG